jgi:hypothetical protein
MNFGQKLLEKEVNFRFASDKEKLVAVNNNIQITGLKNLCTMKFLTSQLQ